MIKGYFNLNGTILEIGKQDFIEDSVEIKINEEIIKCPMFSDEDGDIGFFYKDEVIYFKFVIY